MLSSRDLGLLILVNVIWGFNLISSKIGVTHFEPLWFSTLRFGLLSLVLVPFLRPLPNMRALLAAAACSGPLQFALLFAGLAKADDVSTVAIATQLGVPFATLLSVLLLGEHIRWRRTLGILLAFGGVVVIGLDPRVLQYWEGLGLVILSCAFGSLGLILIKQLDRIPPLEWQAWIGIMSWPPLAIASWLSEDGQWSAVSGAGWLEWGSLAFTTLVSSLIAHTALFYLIQRYPVSSVTPLTLLSPLFGIFFGVLLLDDQLTARMLLGGLITLAGVFIVSVRDRRIVDTGT